MNGALMIQGTASDVGKSLLVAGLCRLFARRGLSVCPFKPQNMSNNAAVAEGGEIGRAQALQARAAGLSPHVDMNPVLLKPEGERGSQLVVRGRVRGRVHARDWHRLRAAVLEEVLEAFHRLRRRFDLVLVEGAGGAAEVNLRAHDVANMGFARAAGVPVVLVGDVSRGGVIAALVGTVALLDADDRDLLRGFVVNGFRGDPALFAPAVPVIEERTGLPCLGIVPWFAEAVHLPAEDRLGLEARARRPREGAGLRIAVVDIPRISNFDDLDPLAAEPGVSLGLVGLHDSLDPATDLLILPGSKATCADLAAIRESGFVHEIHAHRRRGGHVLGICGGYQMLGRWIHDPEGLEGPAGSRPGLGLLGVETVLRREKTVRPVAGTDRLRGVPVSGYEIHLGESDGPDRARPFLSLDGRPEGAVSADGRVMGTYVHGLFVEDAFRRAFLAQLGATPSDLAFEDLLERTLDRLADHLEAALDVERLLAFALSAAPAQR
ncbi:Cobyric acid synthase [bacterium HR39]|nr:Cobyric acid synthase [bacterium HR39]